jgi:hypothetical protein
MAANRITDSEADLGTLVKGIVQDAERLAKQHIDLFKKDIKQDLRQFRDAAISLGAGAVVLLIGGVVLAMALAEGLVALNLPDWAAYGLVGIVIAAVGGALVFMGLNKIKQATPVAEHTVETLEEDVQWMKNPK